MSTFLIDAENNITALDSPDHAEAGQTFTSEDELGQLFAAWPASRLIEVWNSIPGLTPVRKFRDRSTAVSRIWRAIQSLNGTVQTEAATPRKRRPAKTGQSPKSKQGKPEKTRKHGNDRKPQPAARQGSKESQILDLLQQKGGATLNEIMKATDWQAHSVRGFISGTLTKDMGLKVVSSKRESGERVYRVSR
jgi:hypothetical protein